MLNKFLKLAMLIGISGAFIVGCDKKEETTSTPAPTETENITAPAEAQVTIDETITVDDSTLGTTTETTEMITDAESAESSANDSTLESNATSNSAQ